MAERDPLQSYINRAGEAVHHAINPLPQNQEKKMKISPLPERAEGISVGWALPGVPSPCELNTGSGQLCPPSAYHPFGLEVEVEAGDRCEQVLPEDLERRWRTVQQSGAPTMERGLSTRGSLLVTGGLLISSSQT